MPKYKRPKSRSTLSFIPWWVFLILAAGTLYFVKYRLSTFYIENDSGEWAINVLNSLFHTRILVNISYGLDAVLVLLAVTSFGKNYSRKRFLTRRRSIEELRSMPWQEFELLVAALYRKQGYKVEETGLGGADGGIDLVMRYRSETIIVQCKKWGSTSIGAPVVREMYGLMKHHEADQVKIVCVGKFTKEAVLFAEGKPIDLVTGDEVLKMIRG